MWFIESIILEKILIFKVDNWSLKSLLVLKALIKFLGISQRIFGIKKAPNEARYAPRCRYIKQIKF